MLSGYEIILIFALALIFFGAKKIPELARGLGRGLREFRKASREVTGEFENLIESGAYSPPYATTSSSDSAAAPPSRAPATASDAVKP